MVPVATAVEVEVPDAAQLCRLYPGLAACVRALQPQVQVCGVMWSTKFGDMTYLQEDLGVCPLLVHQNHQQHQFLPFYQL